MDYPLRDFYEGLGRAGGGPSFGAAPIDATQAMAKIVTQYVTLSTQADQLRQVLAAGGKVPCDVWMAYALARQDYLTKSQGVFDQLASKGITIEQVVYSGGKPRLDPSDPSKVVTVQVQAPLRPPAFLGLSNQCPTLPNMSGADVFAGTYQPVALGGSISNSVLSGLIGGYAAAMIMVASGGALLGVAGYAGYKTYKQVAVILDDYDSSPSRILSAYTSCVASNVKNGLAPTDAANRCSSVQQSAQQYGIDKAKADAAKANGLGFWGWLGVGTGVVIVGYFVYTYVRSKAGAAARLVSPVPISGLDGVALGELYFRPHGGRRRGRR